MERNQRQEIPAEQAMDLTIANTDVIQHSGDQRYIFTPVPRYRPREYRGQS